MEGERILLITGKFPGMSHDMDGGSIMVHHLIDIFGSNNKLDILFTRTYNNCFQTYCSYQTCLWRRGKIQNENTQSGSATIMATPQAFYPATLE